MEGKGIILVALLLLSVALEGEAGCEKLISPGYKKCGDNFCRWNEECKYTGVVCIRAPCKEATKCVPPNSLFA